MAFAGGLARLNQAQRILPRNEPYSGSDRTKRDVANHTLNKTQTLGLVSMRGYRFRLSVTSLCKDRGT